jgi:hypothetical protein
LVSLKYQSCLLLSAWWSNAAKLTAIARFTETRRNSRVSFVKIQLLNTKF